MARENERPERGSAGAGRRGTERNSFRRSDNNNEGKKIYNRRDKYERGEGKEGGEHRSFGKDRRESGEKRPFGGERNYSDRKPAGNREFGERRSFNADKGESRGGERRTFAHREHGERRSFNSDRDREGSRGGERKPAREFNREDKSSYRDRSESGERRSFGGDRRESSDRRSFGSRREDGDKRPFGATGRDEKRPFNPDRRDDRPNRFNREERGGERRSFKSDRQEGRNTGHSRFREEREERPSFGGKRDFGGEKKSFKDRNSKPDTRKGGFHTSNEDANPETPTYNLKRYNDNPRIKKTNRKEEEDGTIRLNRFIANAGICSRREADSLIEAGEIKVNGEVVTEMGFKVNPEDTVQYGKKILNREKLVYVLLNKPKDFITTTDDPEGRKTVMSLVEKASTERIFPVGRLDRNTTGLLLFTNDGELAQKLTHPSNGIKKIYQVELDKPITNEDFKKVVEGVELEDGKAEVDDVALLGDSKKFLGLEIHIGRNRIVRRIFEHLGYEVVTLDRVQYAGLTKKDVPRGSWRYLSEKEVIRLKFFM